MSTACIFICGLALSVTTGLLSFQFICFLIIFLPALAPFYAWDVESTRLFSLAAPYLQTDYELIDKTVFLFALAAIMYVSTVLIGATLNKQESNWQNKRVKVLSSVTLYFISFMVLLSAYVIESGPTIITANYVEILNSRMESTPILVLASQLFGALWAMLLVFGRHKKLLFTTVTITALVWFQLHSRRVELFGVVTALILWLRYTMNSKWLLVLIMMFVLTQIAVGFVRDKALVEYTSIGNMLERSPELTMRAALPGGASNVFLSGLHLVDQKDQGHLSFKQQLTMLEWVRALVPNIILNYLGFEAIKTEHDLIFQKLDLNYVGGMPLLGAFYLNGGIIFVILFGVLHGILAHRIEKIVARDLFNNLSSGGTISLFFVVIFVVYQFRFQWYNPETLLRAVEFGGVLLIITHIFGRWQQLGVKNIKSPLRNFLPTMMHYKKSG